MKIFIFFISVFLCFSINAKEKVLLCKMNYGISGENDETDIEFKNLSIIDQTQTIYLDIEERWLDVESKIDFENSGGKYTKSDFQISDSNIFSVSFLNNNGVLIRKNVIELNRYSGFVKHEFKTNNETIYRTGYCELSKKQKLF